MAGMAFIVYPSGFFWFRAAHAIPIYCEPVFSIDNKEYIIVAYLTGVHRSSLMNTVGYYVFLPMGSAESVLHQRQYVLYDY